MAKYLYSSEDHDDVLDALTGALAHRRRRAVFSRLCRASATTSQLAAEVGVGLPTMHQHLERLRSAGLVTSHKDGRVVTHRAEFAPLEHLEGWIAERQSFWNEQLSALAGALEGSTDV